MEAILVYLYNDKDACLSLSNSTILVAIFFGTIQPITFLYSYRFFLVRFNQSCYIIGTGLWYDSANNIPGFVPKGGHCVCFENRFIPVLSVEEIGRIFADLLEIISFSSFILYISASICKESESINF